MKRAENLICRVALALGVIYFTGCAAIVYVPGSQNVPMLQAKKEARISTLLAATSNLKGPELQLAYAPLNNIGVLMNGSYLWGGGDDYMGNGSQLEAAVGYFRPVGQNWLVEMYAGAGQAKGEVYDFNYYPRTTERKFTTWFTQPAFGYTGNHFEVAFSTKIIAIKYDRPLEFREKDMTAANIQNNFFFGTPYPSTIVRYGQEFFAVEPALTMRAGGKHAKFQVQLIFSNNDLPDDYSKDFKMTAGATFYISPRFRKIPE